jgi:transposase
MDSQKKTVVAREQDRSDVQAKRATFIASQAGLDAKKLIFLDESGFRLGSPPNYGWAPLGEKAPGKATCGDWCSMTMIGAVALDGWRGFITIDAAMDGDVFLAYVTQELVPQLRPGDIVVMDNLNSHKGPAAIAAIHAAKADVLFLPPYSPDLNPTPWLPDNFHRYTRIRRHGGILGQSHHRAFRGLALGDAAGGSGSISN